MKSILVTAITIFISVILGNVIWHLCGSTPKEQEQEICSAVHNEIQIVVETKTILQHAIDTVFHPSVLDKLPEGINEFKEVFIVLWSIENSFKFDDIGAAGELGPLQFTEDAWNEGCEHANLQNDPAFTFNEKNCKNLYKAIRVTWAYWQRYAANEVQEHDIEFLVRMHNGGPTGAMSDTTLDYWKKYQTRRDYLAKEYYDNTTD